MKKNRLLSLILICSLFHLPKCIKAQDNVMSVNYNDERKILFNIKDVESVTFENAENYSSDSFFKESNTVISGDLNSGSTLKLPLNQIRRNTLLCASVSATLFEKVLIGLGYHDYEGYWLEIDKEKVRVIHYVQDEEALHEYKHNLDIKDNLTITIDYGSTETANVLLATDYGSSIEQVPWWGGGAAFITNKGCQPLNANLSFIPKDAHQPIWFFSDSYFNWIAPWRWPYYLYSTGIKSWMASHKPGSKSPESIESFKNCLRFGTPKYAVWCLGMNDGSDDDTVSKSWSKHIEEFLNICKLHNIEPILTTIPSVPGRNHQEKTNWIRKSGYRYIDFCKAVGADDDPHWLPDMLSKDEVHPDPKGAKAMYEQLLRDFPEIAE